MIADFHSHLIPGVDDGAATLDQALRAIETMHGQGIDAIVTTPHLNASELRRKADWNDAIGRLDRAWEQLQVAAADKFPNVRLERGVELALDEPELARDDHRL